MTRELPSHSAYFHAAVNLGRPEYVKVIVESGNISDHDLHCYHSNLKSWIRGVKRESIVNYNTERVINIRKIAAYLTEYFER